LCKTNGHMIDITGTNVTIMAKDMDVAINFYESIGLNLQNRWGDHYAMMTTTGITIGIHPANQETDLTSGSVSIGFMPDSLEEAKELLHKNNIAFKIDDGKSGAYLHFKDPDGTVLYFVKPKW
ncbi:MAG: VOC family protein, partial [Ginsengibacter sp.]